MKNFYLILTTLTFVIVFPPYVFAEQNAERSNRFIGQELTPQFIFKLDKLSQQGDLEATILLADTNYDVYRDYPKAFNLYKIAANKRDSYAINKLGWMYLDAKGVKKNERNAAICFTQTASNKSFEGLRYLAHMYVNGIGVEQNNIIAHALYQIAIPLDSSRNYVEIANRNAIAKNMSSNQMVEANLLTKKLLVSNNYFTAIEKYLNEHGKVGFYGKPLLAFELAPS
jgi:TPR repeat protein